MTAPRMELRRPMETAPTEPGHFYGRIRHYGPKRPRPWNVVRHNGGLYAVASSMDWYPVDSLEWFGTVPVCVAPDEDECPECHQ